MKNKKYVIYDRTLHMYVSFSKDVLSIINWTDISRYANRYTFKQALFEKELISKVCYIKPEDLVIMEI